MGRKWRRRRSTMMEIQARAKKANVSDPIEDFIVVDTS